MNTKQMAALCSTLSLILSGAAYADSAMSGGMSEHNKSQMPMFEQGSPIADDQVMSDQQSKKFMVPAGINHPGCIRTSGNDFFATGSFIYWMASSDGFNTNEFPYKLDSAGGAVASGHGKEVFVKPKYKPGFKIGLGFNSDYDDWTAYLEYTWLHQSDHSRFTAASGDVFLVSGAPYNVASDLLKTKWKLHLDVLDFTLARAYYVGKRVIVEPFGGLRAAWIRQKWNLELSSSSATNPWATATSVTDYLNANFKGNSWGLGARFGIHSEWLMGSGFRFDAKASGSLLFTRYDKLNATGTSSGGSTAIPMATMSYYKHFDVMRANAEMGLGLGWGSYFGDSDAYHFDIVATYDFNIWLSQNMSRGIRDTLTNQSGVNPTDLMYHGPTLTLRLDF